MSCTDYRSATVSGDTPDHTHFPPQGAQIDTNAARGMIWSSLVPRLTPTQGDGLYLAPDGMLDLANTSGHPGILDLGADFLFPPEFFCDSGALQDGNDLGMMMPADLDLGSRHCYQNRFSRLLSDEEIIDDLPPPIDIKPMDEQVGEPTYIVRRKASDFDKAVRALNLVFANVDGKRICPVKNCRESFKREYNARMHVLHVHLNLRRYECTKCHWKSKRKYDMLRHLKTHKKKE